MDIVYLRITHFAKSFIQNLSVSRIKHKLKTVSISFLFACSSW